MWKNKKRDWNKEGQKENKNEQLEKGGKKENRYRKNK